MNNKLIWGMVAAATIAIVAVAFLSTDGKLTNVKPSQKQRSYRIDSIATSVTFYPNKPQHYRFKVRDYEGNAVKEFDMVHEKIMHFIVVRKDLAEFQHLHPEFDSADGEFTLQDLTLPSDGPYRLFADFTPTASQTGQTGEKPPVTVYEDITVGNTTKYKPRPLGNPTTTKEVDGYIVTLSTGNAELTSGAATELTFTIKEDKGPVVNLEPYLGAYGHAVILQEGSLNFIHAHPTAAVQPKDGAVKFMTTLPQQGTYKVFGQFQVDQKVITADFTLEAIAGGEDAKHMDHGAMGH